MCTAKPHLVLLVGMCASSGRWGCCRFQIATLAGIWSWLVCLLQAPVKGNSVMLARKEVWLLVETTLRKLPRTESSAVVITLIVKKSLKLGLLPLRLCAVTVACGTVTASFI